MIIRVSRPWRRWLADTVTWVSAVGRHQLVAGHGEGGVEAAQRADHPVAVEGRPGVVEVDEGGPALGLVDRAPAG